MLDMLKPIKTDSLKSVFISRFEKLILSGKLRIGQKLPSERELAMQMGVSRPVVHEGLVELAFKGLISMKPRAGAVINDYRKEGSLALLESLFNYQQGNIDPELLEGLLAMRMHFETEIVRLAVSNHTPGHIGEFEKLMQKRRSLKYDRPEAVAQWDFAFHHLLAMASGNPVYPLFLNSFKPVYTSLSALFFTDSENTKWTFDKQDILLKAIREKNRKVAVSTMKRLLKHGAQRLKKAAGF